jgi:hypothetical protein
MKASIPGNARWGRGFRPPIQLADRVLSVNRNMKASIPGEPQQFQSGARTRTCHVGTYADARLRSETAVSDAQWGDGFCPAAELRLGVLSFLSPIQVTDCVVSVNRNMKASVPGEPQQFQSGALTHTCHVGTYADARLRSESAVSDALSGRGFCPTAVLPLGVLSFRSRALL